MVGGIRVRGNITEEIEVSGLYYLGRVYVNGTLQSIRADGPINFINDDSNVEGRFALFIIRNNTVYERFNVMTNNEDELRGQEGNLDVKESDDILVFIYKICELIDNRTLCPWQVNLPSDNTTSNYYDGSDDIMTTPGNSSMFNVEVGNYFLMNSTISTNTFLNVEVTITGNFDCWGECHCLQGMHDYYVRMML